MKTLRLGVIGLDTSHVGAFADILHGASYPNHSTAARIVAGFAGGSPDFEISFSRVGKFARELEEKHDVKIVGNISELKGLCDGVLLESLDGRIHLEQFREIAEWCLPVFIDKQLAISFEEAKAITELADKNEVRLMTASPLRFSESFQEALRDEDGGPITGADFYGPLAFQEIAPGYFWYGIHTAEMLYAAFGPGCRTVHAVRNGDHDLIVACWADGRIGTIRGNRTGNADFGGTLHREKRSWLFQEATSKRSFYEGLLDEIISFFTGGNNPVPFEESLEVIRFLEAANESVAKGKLVQLL